MTKKQYQDIIDKYAAENAELTAKVERLDETIEDLRSRETDITPGSLPIRGWKRSR